MDVHIFILVMPGRNIALLSIKVQVLLLYSVTQPDSFSSISQPNPWQGTHPALV